MPTKAQNVVAKREPRMTKRMEAFVEAYFACGMNGTEAASIAGYAGDRRALAASASRTLRNVSVRARIEARLAEYHLTGNEVLARLAAHARGTMEDFIDPQSMTLDLKRAKEARALHLVKKYRTKFITTTDKDGNGIETLETEFELYDAQAALVHIGKHLGLFAPDTVNNFPLTNLSDEQLRALSEGKRLIDATVTK